MGARVCVRVCAAVAGDWVERRCCLAINRKSGATLVSRACQTAKQCTA